MLTVLAEIERRIRDSHYFRFGFFFWFGILFFLPCLYLLANVHQTFATMEEANMAYYISREGGFATAKRLYDQYTSEGWNRHHFLGLFWDILILSIHGMPRALRLMRLFEIGLISGVLGTLLFPTLRNVSVRISVLFSTCLISIILFSMPLAISYAAIYELEGCILALVSLALFLDSGRIRYLGFLPLFALLITKETFVPVGIGIAFFVLIREYFPSRKTRDRRFLASLFGSIILMSFALYYYWSLSKTGSYAGHYGSPIESLPALLKWKLGIEISVIEFFVSFGLILVGLMVLVILSRTFRLKILIGLNSSFGIGVLFLVLSEGYRFMVYPWIKEDPFAYYYLPCWVFSTLGFGFMVASILSAYFKKYLKMKYVQLAFVTVLSFGILVNAKGANYDLFLAGKERIEHMKLLEVLDQVSNLSPDGKIAAYPIFSEGIIRLSESNQVLRGASRPFQFQSYDDFSLLKSCWENFKCNFALIEKFDPEVKDFFASQKNTVTIKLGLYRLFIRSSSSE